MEKSLKNNFTNLVISDHKSIWNENKNLLVGSWCLLKENDLKNYKIIDYHWDSKIKIKNDLIYIENFYDKLLKIISKNLNTFHKTNYEYDYWEILISKWLQFYLIFLLDRWRIIENIDQKYQNLTANIINFDNLKFIPDNTADYSYYISETDWNHWIFSNILDHFPRIKKKPINLDQTEPSLKKFTKKQKFNDLVALLLKPFNSKDIFSQNFLHGKLSNLFFKFTNRQFSENISLSKFKSDNKIDLNLRNRFCDSIQTSQSEFEKFVFNQIMYNFPKIFLEDFSMAKNCINNMCLPKNPKIVITSLDHHFNDLFKIYAGEKKIKGSKLYIFQHGGTYGSSDPCPTENLDIKIADKYFSWGWQDIKEKKIHPFYCQRYFFKKPTVKNKGEGIILPITEMPIIPSNIHDGRPRNKMDLDTYINQIKTFFNNLNEKISSKSRIKTFPNHRFNYVKDNLKHQLKEIKIIESNLITMKHLNRFKLYVETVNSTGYLESLMLNYPTILIFDKKYCNFRRSSQEDFLKLEKCNILFYSPVEASDFVNKNYDNLNNWWSSLEVQKQRKSFCEKYIRLSKKPLEDLKKVLN